MTKNLKVRVDRGTKCKLYFYLELLQLMLGFKVVLDWRVSGQILEAIQLSLIAYQIEEYLMNL